MARIIVAGGNFSGLTSALELRRKIGHHHEITLISKSPDFLFVPSLIWVPLGMRKLKDLTIPLKPVTRRAGVSFICAEITEVVAEEKMVRCGDKEFHYDYLIMAVGPEWSFDQIPGAGSRNNISYIVNPESALEARQRWLKFITEPGPAVIGVAPGSQCSGPAYEFLFNLEKRCRDLGIRRQVNITFITPEPYLGHLGLGGMLGSNLALKTMLPMFNINYVTNAEIREVTNHVLILKGGGEIPYKYLMIMPKFKGAKVIQNSKGLGNSAAFIPVKDTYQHQKYPDIFGVGIAADLPMKFRTPVSIGIPKTGYAADESAKTAAENIARLLKGNHKLENKPMSEIPELCIMDAGGKEMLTFSDHLLKPRRFSLILPNPFSNSSKLLFEKYYLWKVRRGLSRLP